MDNSEYVYTFQDDVYFEKDDLYDVSPDTFVTIMFSFDYLLT